MNILIHFQASGYTTRKMLNFVLLLKNNNYGYLLKNVIACLYHFLIMI
jgi:hypothetical protein